MPPGVELYCELVMEYRLMRPVLSRRRVLSRFEPGSVVRT